jgi:hypothetical protein
MVDVFTPPSAPPVNNSPAQPVRVAAPDPTARAPAVQSNPALSPPQERWAADRAAIAASDPWQQDPSKVAMVKDPATGEITARARDGSTTGDPANPGDPAQATVDGGKLCIGEMLLDEKDIRQIMTETAAREARKATMPATAADYKLDLPSDFVLPQGQTYKFATDDPVLGPLLGQAKQVAHELGIDQSGFSRLLGLFAASQINEQRMIAAAGAKELAKLGENATNRIDAVRTFLRGHLGDKLAGALSLSMLRADQVEGYEKLMQKFSSQGGGSWSGANREVAKTTISDEAYNRMTYSERKAYAEAASQHEQAIRR